MFALPELVAWFRDVGVDLADDEDEDEGENDPASRSFVALESQIESWAVRSRLPVIDLVEDPVIAPHLRREARIAFTAECPKGHQVAIFASREVVGAFAVEERPSLPCRQCERAYFIDLGSWPETFPGL